MSSAFSLILAAFTWARAVSWRSGLQVAAIALLTWMWVLVWSTTDKPDYAAYQAMYARSERGTRTEVGYWALSRVAVDVGLSYDLFAAVVGAVALLLLTSTIRRYTDNLAYVLVLYFFLPFIYDTIQLRKFLAFSVVFFSLR